MVALAVVGIARGQAIKSLAGLLLPEGPIHVC